MRRIYGEPEDSAWLPSNSAQLFERLTRLQGSISKRDIELFFRYAKVEYKLNVLEKSLNAVATAELEAIKENYTQSCISE
ncbi:MAG: hypothetical protein LQ351_004562 [Letrouitia transgressa]|nr:MAG: hypothetical protein LQ351_004562 [Letrouitia transgressa]